MSGLPDMEFIRRQIPIVEVARELGIRTAGPNTAHCWRVGAHQNGDRSPSMAFRRNRAKCQVCDADSMSVLDLVIKFQVLPNSALKAATQWICSHWTVPKIAKNTKLSRPERWSTSPVGLSSFPLERFIRSGIWAKLDHGARSILPVLFCFAERDAACISYRALRRYSGTSSDATIAKALRQLKQIGILESPPKTSNNFRDAGRYYFTLDSPKFQSMLTSVHDQLRFERDGERELRAQRRNALPATRKQGSADTQVQVLSSANEVSEKVRTTRAVAWNEVGTEGKTPIPQDSRPENKATYEECTLHPVKCDNGTAFPFGWNVEGASA
jgi:hypothetical protein